MSRNQRRNKRNKPGSSQNTNRNATRDNTEDASVGAVHHRSSTETKSSLRTTELLAYAGAVLAVIMTALAVDEDGQGRNDPFGAESALRYITYLTIGYLLARGLSKSGSHENRIEHNTDIDDDAERTGVVHDDDDGDDGGERVGDDDIAETAVVTSDRVKRSAAENADVTP